MPKRVTNRKIETPELQGEDSYIVLKRMPYAMIREARKFTMMGDVSERQDLTPDEKQEWLDKETDATEKLLFESILDWNWVDDVGEPMSIPKTRADLDRLTADEVSFILNTITGVTQAAQEEKKD